MPRYVVRLTRTSKFTGTLRLIADDREAAEAMAEEVLGLATHQRLSTPTEQVVWVTPLGSATIYWDEAPDDECGTEAAGMDEVGDLAGALESLLSFHEDAGDSDPPDIRVLVSMLRERIKEVAAALAD